MSAVKSSFNLNINLDDPDLFESSQPPDQEPDNNNEKDSDKDPSPKIRELDHTTSSVIRKSQVITKVLDVVRELVENAIDADATVVKINLKNHGLDLIEVIDNGHGIAPSDVPLIFQGGHTSKLNDTNRLTRDKYLGFKGEALNAICAIGATSMSTKTVEDPHGRHYQFDRCGNVTDQSTKNCLKGTHIEVRRLFQAFPVRRKMYENASKAKQEMKEIEVFLKGVGIAYPQCHITFRYGDNNVWSKPAVKTVEQSLCTVLGSAMAKKLGKWGPVNVKTDGGGGIGSKDRRTMIELHLPKKPVDMRTLSFTSNSLAMIFCNRKRIYIREFEKLIHRYITAVVEKSQPADQRRFPVSVLSITLPPEEVDFNRETDKTKVFLVNKDKIFEAVEDALASFYEINLKESDSNKNCKTSSDVPEGRPSSPSDIWMEANGIGKSNCAAKEEENAVSKDRTTTTTFRKTVNTNRQELITSFIKELPSTSTAFSNSPTKAQNAEGSLMTFPPSKPVVETKRLDLDATKEKVLEQQQQDLVKTPSSNCSRVVSNFNINFSFGSQDLETEEPLAPSLPPKNAEAPCRSSDDQFSGWLDGRAKDLQGQIVENINVVKETPEVAKKSNDDYETFCSKLFFPSKPSSLPSSSIRSSPAVSVDFRRPAPAKSPGPSSASRLHREDDLQESASKRPRLDMPPPQSPIPPRTPTPPLSSPALPERLRSVLESPFLRPPVTPPPISPAVERLRSILESPGVRSQYYNHDPHPIQQPGFNRDINPGTFDVWPRPPAVFSQCASMGIAGVRLPLSFPPPRPQPVWPSCGNGSFHYEMTPKVIGKIQMKPEDPECYVVQTRDTIGAFFPEVMMENFPEEGLQDNEAGVAHLFSRFIERSDIQCSSASPRIFVKFSDVDSKLRAVYSSMENELRAPLLY